MVCNAFNIRLNLSWANINTPLYCKRYYFRWGKFRENVGRTFHVGVIFTILLIFLSERHAGFIFAWGNFREDGKIAKTAKITPTRKFQRLQYYVIWSFSLCDYYMYSEGMSCMISFVNPEESIHRERDGFIKFSAIIKRYVSAG